MHLINTATWLAGLLSMAEAGEWVEPEAWKDYERYYVPVDREFSYDSQDGV